MKDNIKKVIIWRLDGQDAIYDGSGFFVLTELIK